MFLQNSNKYNFILTKQCNFHTLIPFISEGEKHHWSVEYIKIAANEVVFNNTKNSEEIIIVIGGSGGATINGEGALIKAGNIIHFRKNTIRSLANVDEKELLQVICITISSALV